MFVCSCYFPVWGWVGYGYSNNLTPAAELKKKESEPYNIIVSRSHAGTVEDVVKGVFGGDTMVTPAGGAGNVT